MREQVQAAILAAAWALTVERGYRGLTVEGIAAPAGTGKQTVHRWWPSKADVLLDALRAKADGQIGLDDHGSYRADLRAFLERTFRLGLDPTVTSVTRTLMAQAQIDPEFGAGFREQFMGHRRVAFEVLTDRAEARDYPAGRSPAFDARLVFGVLWYEVLAAPTPLGPEPTDPGPLVARLLDQLTRDLDQEGHR